MLFAEEFENEQMDGPIQEVGFVVPCSLEDQITSFEARVPGQSWSWSFQGRISEMDKYSALEPCLWTEVCTRHDKKFAPDNATIILS